MKLDLSDWIFLAVSVVLYVGYIVAKSRYPRLEVPPVAPFWYSALCLFIAVALRIGVDFNDVLTPAADHRTVDLYLLMITSLSYLAAAISALMSFNTLYDVQPRELPRWRARVVRMLDAIMPLKIASGDPSIKYTIGTALISYALVVYTFALLFEVSCRIDPKAFSQRLDLIDSLYFSIVTIATVGYGDITPVAKGARIIVSVEIMLGVMYQIFFFSILATIARISATEGRRS